MLKNKKILTSFDNKKYTFSTYFIINDNRLFSTSNKNFEDNLNNCFYIKKYGSNIHPIIFIDIKVNNEWVVNNQIVGSYNELIDFIFENQNSFICLRGFSRASIGAIIRKTNELKGTNIKPVKFKSKFAEANYERHIIGKEKRLISLKKKLSTISELDSAEQYMKIANSVFGEERHKSRQRVMKLRDK